MQLQKLFVRLLLLNQQSADVDALTTSFGWKNNEVKSKLSGVACLTLNGYRLILPRGMRCMHVCKYARTTFHVHGFLCFTVGIPTA